MSALRSLLPVVLCGRTSAIGKPVSQALLPEYEVIHFIQTSEAAQAELPALLAGRDPKPTHTNDIGTHEYSKPARAVIFGRGFPLDEVQSLQKACSGINKDPVAWIVGDPAKAPGPNTPPPGPGYAQVAANSVKDVLATWAQRGAVKDEIILY
ncbi:uncharacterized protein N7459_001291 [Penicillium hispanicum]|uniref:uncharacterized protein n=1 Tax=Penicillium hispanicum TaxID=1080232 RepID=UPI002541DF3B|nr:uncharacterized protein N7459_001291 [Penicillium hispanicum]KAJ5595083.1 hypothetical protein N7459_001291 [Penicillium hispanicum]